MLPTIMYYSLGDVGGLIPPMPTRMSTTQMVGPLGPAGPPPNNVLMLPSISDGDIGV
jgi:hypothetical protein